MKNSTSLLKKILYITIPVVLLGLVVVRLKKNKELAKTNIVQFNKEAAIAVIADTVVLQEVQFPSTFSGTFEPNKETKISYSAFIAYEVLIYQKPCFNRPIIKNLVFYFIYSLECVI